MKRKRVNTGHYCRICHQYKANEKFSGKGHAKHICKACSRLSPSQRKERDEEFISRIEVVYRDEEEIEETIELPFAAEEKLSLEDYDEDFVQELTYYMEDELSLWILNKEFVPRGKKREKILNQICRDFFGVRILTSDEIADDIKELYNNTLERIEKEYKEIGILE